MTSKNQGGKQDAALTPSRPPTAPSDSIVGDALARFHAPHVQEIWATALSRRSADAKGALTSARELLESVCKHILDDAGQTYEDVYQLNQLYHRAAKVLEIAPNQQTEEDFRKIFGACSTIVESIGNLRSDLGDAHGRGKNAPRAGLHHAELAVNLAGAMASYLIAIWESRQQTVGNLIRSYLDNEKSLHISRKYTLKLVLQHQKLPAVVAARLTAQHLIEYAESRSATVRPPTIRQELSALKKPFKIAHTSLGIEAPIHAFDQAWKLLSERQVIGKANRRERRPTAEELERLAALFAKQDSNARTITPMGTLMEFALESARNVSEICALRWTDVKQDEFSDAAWAIIQAQPKMDDRVFPYEDKTVSSRFTRAVAKLGIEDLEFRDLRFEAIVRLFENGLYMHEVQRLTGIRDPITLSRYFEQYGKGSPANASTKSASTQEELAG